ncbi:MAG: hypothetical protein P1U91_03440 [Pseudophaeobacter sp. bin_em_oilr2.035]|uniref:Uncharacterized protein n=1 Tax=Phaeobacter gallaeciensis TaxID=60890 RepID=A0ABD4X9C4_9RHOB|nr:MULTISPECIES: hypothetical protein [Phaeobacter]MDF1770987.1 hypothetical protein [Pseudophaeobacter sp. bin_em_oilr2.035]MEE2635286.1 hypothetical protein [Pseudomonadota bacterium]MDE4061230.1 hypothetical protein [Phaeobacter gallaeciensis]MDE4124249.1 hypothetical protein [Phaeobacter gallaeciensis]MDE4128895.1 hypothetical protein [Phaeobacter gallaeciensis]
MARSWHILREEGALTLCRQRPPRFDVAVAADLPKADPLRLAHQIRQDMWRALRDVRGFSPVVRVAQTAEGVRVTAGGRVLGLVSPVLAERIEAVLEKPANRGRWLRHAARGQGADL